MEFRTLRYFLMVAREQNITKAAQLLHVTQPTLSRQLVQLEEELGVKLFERRPYGIALNEEGMMFKRRAQELVSLAEKAKNELTSCKRELTGEITIGCGELLSVDILAKIIKEFHAEYPLVRFNLHTANADHVKERIELGLLDIGLLHVPVDVSKHDFLRISKKEIWGVFVWEGSSIDGKTSVSPEDLIGFSLLVPRRPLIQNELANWFGDLYDQVQIPITYNLFYNAAIMARNGLGVVLCPKVDIVLDGMHFIPLSPPIESSSVLVWKKNQMQMPVVDVFVDFAGKYIRDISVNTD